jgi:hypothetical protein
MVAYEGLGLPFLCLTPFRSSSGLSTAAIMPPLGRLLRNRRPGSGGNAGIACCGRQFTMPQKGLNDADIHAALQQMGRKTVPHRARGASSTRRVQRDRFW